MLSWSPDTFVCSTSGSASKTMLSTPAADTEPATKMYKTTKTTFYIMTFQSFFTIYSTFKQLYF